MARRNDFHIIQDESIAVNDPARGRRYWSPEGEQVVTGYNGRHERAVLYGAFTDDGRRFFRTRDRFDKETFLWYLKKLHKRFGKTVLIMDKASQHTSPTVGRYLKGNFATLRVIYLPTATPELSAIEEYWKQAKRDVLVSEYYSTLGEMRRMLSEYMRTKAIDLDVMRYVCRQSLV